MSHTKKRRLQLIEKVRRLREEYFRAFDELLEVTISFDEPGEEPTEGEERP